MIKIFSTHGNTINVKIPSAKPSEVSTTASKVNYSDSLFFGPKQEEALNKKISSRPSSAKSDMRSKKSQILCTTCNSVNCHCGIEVKSYGTDIPQQARNNWIRRSNEVTNKKEPEFLDILDDIKVTDVERFQSEYPRKDHIMPIQRKCVQDTLLYKLVYDKSLGIWDFLLRNRFSGLRRVRKEVKSKYLD